MMAKYLTYSNDELAKVDPIRMNLSVLCDIPEQYCFKFDVGRYVKMADAWAVEFREWLRFNEHHFQRDPGYWRNDLRFFNLCLLHQYMGEVLGIAYREDHRAIQENIRWEREKYTNQESLLIDGRPLWALRPPGVPGVSYTDPTTLFVHGVMDSRRGTCGNMVVLYVALCWRLGWPVSIACSWSHLFARFDDGITRHNIETSGIGSTGCSAPDDYHYIQNDGIPLEHIRSGSDLTALKPREMLAVFIGSRAAFYEHHHESAHAHAEYQRAVSLFPQSRFLRKRLEETARRAVFALGTSACNAPGWR